VSLKLSVSATYDLKNTVFLFCFIEEKLIDIEDEEGVWPFLSQADDNDTQTSPKPKPAKTEEITQTGKEMWDLLKARKGLVVISKFLRTS
jgi:hypothetical protein